ncbi:UDP-galactopyranose mutase [Parapedobacter sp. GCM10030251]|uniref:UDP-galactopyranose mutase n=1 Tax=Parapedobacter sp. GCM10030251 TaxID=3273419 RepID=UPI0036114447
MTEKPYDYLIVGSGLFGSVCAHELKKGGKRCLVLEKRAHVGGNVYCENDNGINVHVYGAHIFHTNDEQVWDYVNSFVRFNRYTNSPLAVYQNRVYNLPFNMNTFNQLWGITTPEEAQRKIAEQVSQVNIKRPSNLEEQALSMVGFDIYNYFIKGYSAKQWGRHPRDLPAFVIKRIPLRFNYDNNYFNDKYQGIPIGGYNVLIGGLLNGIETKTNTDYLQHRTHWNELAKKVIYTGPIDAFFNYQHGKMDYRSLRFEHERKEMENYQGNAVINYTELEVPYTRIIEHKHFEFGQQSHTVITREYPQQHGTNTEPYYPINDAKNMKLYQQYRDMAKAVPHVIFGGRLAEYRYYDMHQVVASALAKMNKEITKGFASCIIN